MTFKMYGIIGNDYLYLYIAGEHSSPLLVFVH